MITFRIKLVEGGWVPDHEELVNTYMMSDSGDPMETVRAAMFTSIDADYPGVYTLEWPLSEVREQKIAAISARTQILLNEGFLYSGARYSTSAQDQAYCNLLRIYQLGLISGLTMTYPATFASVDGKVIYSASNAASLAFFLGAQATFMRQLMEGDAALKKLVRDATTSAQVQAIQDPR